MLKVGDMIKGEPDTDESVEGRIKVADVGGTRIVIDHINWGIAVLQLLWRGESRLSGPYNLIHDIALLSHSYKQLRYVDQQEYKAGYWWCEWFTDTH